MRDGFDAVSHDGSAARSETDLPEGTAVECDPPVAEIILLRAEIVRLRQENEDLRASALWWMRLYEGLLERDERDCGGTGHQ